MSQDKAPVQGKIDAVKGDGTLANPWLYEAKDYQLNAIRIQVPWDDSDLDLKTINGPALVHRDADCVWSSIIVGPPGGIHMTVVVPIGDTSYSVLQMASIGLISANQLFELEVQAIP